MKRGNVPCQIALYFRTWHIRGRKCTEVCINMSMKRLNPNTNEPFKRGDVREDGRVFYNYTNIVRADGYFTERWVTVETLNKTKSYDKTRNKAKHVRKSTRLPNNYKKFCNYDIHLIYILKNAWQKKHEENYSDEDIREILAGYDELLPLFFE